jgi:hypothetical protein
MRKGKKGQKTPRDPRERGKQERPGRFPEVNQARPNPFPDLRMYEVC